MAGGFVGRGRAVGRAVGLVVAVGAAVYVGATVGLAVAVGGVVAVSVGLAVAVLEGTAVGVSGTRVGLGGAVALGASDATTWTLVVGVTVGTTWATGAAGWQALSSRPTPTEK